MSIIVKTDLPVDVQDHESIDVLVDGANAKAARVAPCLTSSDPAPSEAQLAEARLILLGAIRRWTEAGSGAIQSNTAGPFSQVVDTRPARTGYNLWPSEITALQDLCEVAGRGAAYMVDMTGFAASTNPLAGASINTPEPPTGQWSESA